MNSLGWVHALDVCVCVCACVCVCGWLTWVLSSHVIAEVDTLGVGAGPAQEGGEGGHSPLWEDLFITV